MKNYEYWSNRYVQNLVQSEKSVVEFESQLERVYLTSIKNIKQEIALFYDRYAINNSIDYAEARRRLNVSELAEFKALLVEYTGNKQVLRNSTVYADFLTALSKKKYITRMESLIANLQYEIEKLENEKLEQVQQLLETNYTVNYYNSVYNIAQGTAVPIAFNIPDTDKVKRTVRSRWSNYTFSQSIWSDRDRLVKSLERIIPQSFARGLSSAQLGDELSKEMKVSKSRARTLVRTEVNRICNEADIDSYKDVGIELFQFLATLDMRTSEICRSMDGKIFKVSQASIGENVPPLHPNCRSVTIPYFEDDEDYSSLDRVARDSEGRTISVPRKMDQIEYIKKYADEKNKDKLLKFHKKYSS